MDAQHVIDLLLGGTIGAYWWFTRVIYTRQSELNSEFAAYQKEVAESYATRADMSRIEGKLDRILERLSHPQP